MALFPVVNKNTGEKKEINVSVHTIMDWYKDNPEWVRDWEEGAAAFAESGEWKDKLIKKNPGWNEVLQKASKAGASQSKIGKI